MKENTKKKKLIAVDKIKIEEAMEFPPRKKTAKRWEPNAANKLPE